MKVPITTIPIQQLITECAAYLAHEYDQATAQQYAWWLLEELTHTSRAILLTQQIITLDTHKADQLSAWLDDIVVHHKPLAYVIGHVPFRDLTIFTEPPILIPRPETEEWVSSLIERYKPLAQQPLRILDLCTGTGCIALSFAKAFPNASVVGIDIADQALALAHKNTVHNNINNVTFIHSDLFNGLPSTTQFDLIVANPPYIAEAEKTSLAQSVTQWEDARALFADDDGFAIIKRIIKETPAWLRHTTTIEELHLPQLVLEIGYLQGPQTTKLFTAYGFTNVHCLQDHAHKDRVVMGSYPHVAATKKA